jgi:hypothetical protein
VPYEEQYKKRSSGYVAKDEILSLLELGVRRFVVKPFKCRSNERLEWNLRDG